MTQSITSRENSFTITSPELRQPKGFLLSPYSLLALVRYIANNFFNGCFSYRNPDRARMRLLDKQGNVILGSASGETRGIKIIFLGDIMVSRSGEPPQLDAELQNVLKSADIVVANVESPVVFSDERVSRGLSVQFRMRRAYLQTIHDVNPNAKWVFSLANNHACDTSKQSVRDIHGIEETVQAINSVMKDAEIIGADVEGAKSVLSLKVGQGPTLGIIGWTELMNYDRLHYQKRVVRETDLTDDVVAQIKKEHTFLIGFPHGNEEQSYFPLRETRDRWLRLLGKDKFDAIIGHGPHVLHPGELGSDDRPLFHSIGNFCSPVGKSQTKVGAIPEITLQCCGEEVSSIDYKVTLIQQRANVVEVLDIDAPVQLYPGIVGRLRNIWRTLFCNS